MTVNEHNKMLAIGFGIFAALLGFTFLLLVVVTSGVFILLGITTARESGDQTNAAIGVAGVVFTLLFYGFLGAVSIVPLALASWRMTKRKPRARRWGTIAAIVVCLVFPLGTALGVYGLWFLFSDEGKQFYNALDAHHPQWPGNLSRQ
jgi:hypothetical protein